MEQPPALDIPEEKGTNSTFVDAKDSSLAIASLVTGILGWTLVPVFGAIAAIITGHLAKKEIKESRGKLTGNSMATAGLILGYIAFGIAVLTAIVLIILMLIARANNWLF